MKNKSILVITIVIAALLIILFAWPKISDSTRSLAKTWNKAGVGCLPSHTRANQHIHSNLRIFVDEIEEGVPANIGIVKSCMAELHTHEADNVIHIESVESGKTFKVSDFFKVWGKDLERPGYKLTMTVADQPNNELGDLILKDKQVIILNYTKNEN